MSETYKHNVVYPFSACVGNHLVDNWDVIPDNASPSEAAAIENNRRMFSMVISCVRGLANVHAEYFLDPSYYERKPHVLKDPVYGFKYEVGRGDDKSVVLTWFKHFEFHALAAAMSPIEMLYGPGVEVHTVYDLCTNNLRKIIHPLVSTSDIVRDYLVVIQGVSTFLHDHGPYVADKLITFFRSRNQNNVADGIPRYIPVQHRSLLDDHILWGKRVFKIHDIE